MKRPSWLRGGSDPDPERDEEERPGRKPRAESERAQRERLAKARRERERKARADLAAKARGDSEREGAEKSQDAERPRRAKSREEGDAERKRPGGARPRSAEREKGRAPRQAEPAGKRKAKPAGKARSQPGRKREPTRKRDSGGRAAPLAAAGRIAADVRSWLAATAPRVGGMALRLLVALFAAFFAAVALALNLGIAAWRFARGALRAALEGLDRLSRAASRAVTPTRAVAAVAAGALILLALSQFADYRSISIGNDSYAPGIQTVAPAPVTETDATGSAHAYAMVPLAAIGMLLLAGALGGRRRLCAALALIGLVAVLVALLIDRPEGLDAGDRPLAYEGVKATLVGGFYAEIAAGLLLMASALLLGRELRSAAAGSSQPSRRRWAPPRLRRRARVEGARA